MISPVSRRSLPVLAGLLALTLAACSAAPTLTPLPSGAEPPSDCARVEGGVITLTADNLEFSAPCLVANAGEAFTINFTNLESQPHNVAIYTDSTKADSILEGEIISTEGESLDYAVEALDAGEYYFDCTVHPSDMFGTLYAVEA